MEHDQLFKLLLRTFFVEFVGLFLPQVSAYLERDDLEFLDKEIFTDVTAGEQHVVDLLVKARFRDGDAFFLIHVENQATARPQFARRMFGYFARLHEAFDLPVYPVALFTYDDPRRAEPDHYQVAFPDRTVLDFSFRVIQLNRLSWRDFLRHPNPVAAALMTKMQIAEKDRPRVKVECTRMFATLNLDPARQTLIRNFMDAYLQLSAAEMEVYNCEVATLDPLEREAVMQIVNEWEARGEARGRCRVILRQLHRNLGVLTPSLETRILTLSADQLDDLAEALLDFTTLGELTAWLATKA